MSEATLNLSPSAALAALFSSIGRGLLWITIKGARAPLTTSICGLAVFGMVSATSNALYNQPVDHPAPFFTDTAMVTSSLPPKPTPMVTAIPKPVVQRTAQPVTAATQAAPSPAMPRAVAEIGHSDVKNMQQKLRAKGFYDGEADGFYGPKTAAAIRRFEQQSGLPVSGALTPEILHHINSSPNANLSTSGNRQAPLQRQGSVEKLVQQVASDVVDGSAKLTAVVSEAEQQLRDQVQAATPDPLTQIVQRVANGAPAHPAKPVKTNGTADTSDKSYVKKVQRGLASLGFLHGEIDGIAGEGTARAIRNFEVYYNYQVTGAITPELLDLLANAGAEV